jgi:hypothetical protein
MEEEKTKTKLAVVATQIPDSDMLDANMAFARINEHYGRTFEKIRIMTPQQLIDGVAVDFIEEGLQVHLASARLRFRSRLLVGEDGKMHLDVSMSDLVFSRAKTDTK